MMMAQGRQRFNLAVAVVSLVLLPHAATVALDLHLPHDASPTNTTLSLPPHSAALPTGATDASSSSTALLRPVPVFPDHRRAEASPSTLSDATTVAWRRLLASDFDARRQEDHPTTAAAPSPTLPDHHSRSARLTGYPFYGVTFADLHDACQRQDCDADSFHRLARMLYSRHIRRDDYSDVLCVVRTIEGSRPILPWSWRAVVATGGDVCYVEVGRMHRDSFRIDCPAWTCVRHCTTSPREALQWAVDAISTPCGGASSTSSSAVTSGAAPSPFNAALALLVVAFLPRPLAAAVVLSYLPSLVRGADLSEEEEFLKINHATCTVYPYNNDTGAVWEHHKLTYLYTVGRKCERYIYGAAGPLFRRYAEL